LTCAESEFQLPFGTLPSAETGHRVFVAPNPLTLALAAAMASDLLSVSAREGFQFKLNSVRTASG